MMDEECGEWSQSNAAQTHARCSTRARHTGAFTARSIHHGPAGGAAMTDHGRLSAVITCSGFIGRRSSDPGLAYTLARRGLCCSSTQPSTAKPPLLLLICVAAGSPVAQPSPGGDPTLTSHEPLPTWADSPPRAHVARRT